MKNNTKYFSVGLFVILGILLSIMLVVYLKNDKTEIVGKYLISFNGPISGLSVGSVVKYNGVDVGSVDSIDLNYKDLSKVDVIVSINNRVKINKICVAEIQTQGITGLGYVQVYLPRMQVMSSDFPITTSKPYPEITSKDSLLTQISSDAENISNNVKTITNSAQLFLNESNVQHLNNILVNLDHLTSNMQKQSDMLNTSLSNLNIMSANINKSLNNVNKLTSSLVKTSDGALQSINTIQNNLLSPLSSELIPNMNSSLLNLKTAILEINGLVENINNNPQYLIYGHSKKDAYHQDLEK